MRHSLSVRSYARRRPARHALHVKRFPGRRARAHAHEHVHRDGGISGQGELDASPRRGLGRRHHPQVRLVDRRKVRHVPDVELHQRHVAPVPAVLAQRELHEVQPSLRGPRRLLRGARREIRSRDWHGGGDCPKLGSRAAPTPGESRVTPYDGLFRRQHLLERVDRAPSASHRGRVHVVRVHQPSRIDGVVLHVDRDGCDGEVRGWREGVAAGDHDPCILEPERTAAEQRAVHRQRLELPALAAAVRSVRGLDLVEGAPRVDERPAEVPVGLQSHGGNLAQHGVHVGSADCLQHQTLRLPPQVR